MDKEILSQFDHFGGYNLWDPFPLPSINFQVSRPPNNFCVPIYFQKNIKLKRQVNIVPVDHFKGDNLWEPFPPLSINFQV